MKINLAKSAGFCFGVKRALSIAFETLKTAKNIEMLGDLVHNEDVVTMVKEAGIKKIHRLRNGKNKTLLIRAHGTCNTTLANAKKMGYKIIDATCPMVKEIHTIGCDMEKKGYKIIIIGDKKHDEVRGIIGQLKYKPIVISKFKDLKSPAIRHLKKAAIISQSTQELSKVLKMIHSLKHVIPELKFFNTICQPTRSKQREIKKMPTKNDTMIIIGSKTSANTKRLYSISKKLNKKSYWIQSEKDINPRWFYGTKSVGITAGASTPNSTTQNVIAKIKKIELKNI